MLVQETSGEVSGSGAFDWSMSIDVEKDMHSKSQPLVSVVTPVYNGDEFLAECIESVLAQTYENWEYVIVNNCSTDRSLETAQHYAQQDARIRIHNNDAFLSQYQNWNHALGQISPESKYCKVVHADDWLFPECIARMVEIAEANPSVGIVGAYRLDEDRVNLDRLPYPGTVTSGREICRLSLLGGLRVFGSPTSLLIRSDIIRSRRAFYKESVIHADTDGCFDVLQDHDFGFVHQVLTFTRRHNESLTSLTNRFSTRRLANFIVLLRYGPIYLTEEEYERRLEQELEHYYRFLGRSVFELKGKEFWNYHRRELKKLGYPPSTARLIKACSFELLDFRETTRRLRRAVERNRRQKPSQDAQGNLDVVLGSMCATETDDGNSC
jgi:glycosyltransferase involved in cell wall biosynthesis